MNLAVSINTEMEKLIFPTKIELHDLSTDLDFLQAKTIIQKVEKNTNPHSLIGGGLSSYLNSSPILDHIALSGLKRKIQIIIENYARTIQLGPIIISNSWFNIMGKNQSVRPHRHECSVISGALYVEAPAGSSSLMLHSPLAQLRMNEMLLGSNELNENFHTLPCYEGLLALFPSWLEHSSEPNNNDRRVVISFNTEYGPKHLVSKAFQNWRNSS